jgi:hypothetical protein
MTNAGKQSKHALFKQSFFNWVKEQLAKDPTFNDLKGLLESVRTEANKRLNGKRTIHPFAGFIDELGSITVTAADAKLTFDGLVKELRKLAKEGKARAACICTIVERPSGNGKAPMQFIELHLEHRDSRYMRRRGLALLRGLPVAGQAQSAGYRKGVPALIFHG